ncbi:hypothetical protein [Rufibacter latericius]|uniref:Uncharacterized protein n=1 Tax=Rufibacter latericius TaxID=2487040 RepID=A0A3M9MSS7_9BACT|nr:hypothetical protein [Rufibacter latericius]RNI28574.1 hypothetical protein EFB08_08005 [Rufibacter latericius]
MRAPQQEASIPPFTPLQPCPSYALSWQQPVSIQNLTLTLQKIEDSRCPKDVLCIWAGVAVAQVQLQDSTGESVSQTLSLGEMAKISLGTKTYQLTLREVTPYPRISDLNPAQKEALISISTL